MKSWLKVHATSDFSLHNIPFGIITSPRHTPRVATIIGDTVIDLYALAQLGYFKELSIQTEVFNKPFLNDFIALGKPTTRKVREHIQLLFDQCSCSLQDDEKTLQQILIPAAEVTNLLPIQIGDYTDFYSSRQHAYNVGCMFRDPNNALLPNWLHLPVAYHGRASSIVVSGTPVRRPKGQIKPDGHDTPIFSPSRLLDFELEVAFVVGKPNQQGSTVPTDQAEDHIFGLCLFNDWSARDIQSWEYVPLGPFLSKNFASSLSPWVVTLEALEPFRIEGPTQNPDVLPYLQYRGAGHFDIHLEVLLQAPQQPFVPICASNFKYLYWNMKQQLAHHTVNGCNMNIGDLCASGTISGDTPDSYGSMLELTWRGTKPIELPDGSVRKFLQDGDTLCMRGYAQQGDIRVGFGEVTGTILPAL